GSARAGDRPPAPRAEHAVVGIGVGDLSILVVLRLTTDATIGQPEVDADHSRHPTEQQQRGESDHLGEVGVEAVDDPHCDEEQGREVEDEDRSSHLAAPPVVSCSSLEWPEYSSSSGWFRSNAGRSERIRGSEVKL